jgi:hypothetical protein
MRLLDGIFGKDEIKQLQIQVLEKNQEIVRLGSQIAVANASLFSIEEKLLRQAQIIIDRDVEISNINTSLQFQHEENLRLSSELALHQAASTAQQERDIDLIATLKTALEEAKAYVSIANNEREAREIELQSMRAIYDEKDRNYEDREAKLSALSEKLQKEKQNFQLQVADLQTREHHWKNTVKPQLFRYESHVSLDERQQQLNEQQIRLGNLERLLQDQELDMQRRQCTDEELMLRESEIKNQGSVLTSRTLEIEVRSSALELAETEISSRSNKLEQWARDLRTFQSRVDRLDQEALEIATERTRSQEKIELQQNQHKERLSLIRKQRSDLREEEKRLCQLDILIRNREKDVKREEAKIIDVSNKNFALRNDKKTLSSQVKLLGESLSETQAALEELTVEHEELKTSHQIALSGTMVEKTTALAHPTVLAWLLQEGDPDTAKIEHGWLGTSGQGPWDQESLTTCLEELGYQFYPLSDDELEYIIVGREDWSASDLRSLISSREGLPLRIYSQEMFFAKLTTGRDPFDANDPELLEAFAEDHAALQFLMALPDAWPEISLPADNHVKVVDPGSYGGVTQSPLNILEYHVGVTSKLSSVGRRNILAACLEMKRLPFSDDSSSAYIEQWGRSNSAQRLYRIALHLKILAERQSNEPRMAQAVDDWKKDSKWLKDKYFSKYKSTFTWPSI